MTVFIDNTRYTLTFAHHITAVTDDYAEATEVRLERDGHELSTAYAICAKGDQYSKFAGRKVALTRLLKRLPRSARATVWQQYWKATNRPELAKRCNDEDHGN
jgi:hypothetical protein